MDSILFEDFFGVKDKVSEFSFVNKFVSRVESDKAVSHNVVLCVGNSNTLSGLFLSARN